MSKDTIKTDWDIKLKHTRKRNLKTPLPNNTDSFTLVINKKKTTFEVTNNNEYYKWSGIINYHSIFYEKYQRK